jgi:hypothetical protein
MIARRSILLALLLFLAGSAVVILVREEHSRLNRSVRGEEFQRLLGGIGFGPAVNLSECAFGFDPRLDCTCSQAHGAIPGGACFCPRHGGALFSYPPLNRVPAYLEEDARAGTP